MEETLQFAKGEMQLKTIVVEIPDYTPHFKPGDVVRIRKNLNISQPDFAKALNISPNTLKKWESGKQKPSRTALRLLQLFRLEPKLVSKILSTFSE